MTREKTAAATSGRPTAMIINNPRQPKRLRQLTFLFLRSMTLTPSTDTVRTTFFFLMALALNSYCNTWQSETV